jgi:chromosome segregation ATPase
MGFEIQSQHEPKKSNVGQLSGPEKLEEEQKDQTLLPCKDEVFPGDNLRKKPQHIAALAATSELQNTSEDYDDIDRQQNRLQAKFSQEVTVQDMHLVNENENKFAEHSKNLEALQQKIATLESTCSQEAAKVSQSAKDISTLQVVLKNKDKTMDQMKTAGSKLKSMLSTEQKKSEDLEAANTSMNTELQALKAYIQMLKEFPVQSSDID